MEIEFNSTGMVNFVFKRQPKSHNRGFKSEIAKAIYMQEIEHSIRKFNEATTLTEELYGVIYYFFKKNTGTDADNISKPMWDCLKGILFNDDKQIKLRTAGNIDISKGGIQFIDFSKIKGEIITELLEAFDTNEHIVYVECGRLKHSMYKFSWESDGN